MDNRKTFIATIEKALARGGDNVADPSLFTTSPSAEERETLVRIKSRTATERNELLQVLTQVAGPLHIDFHPERSVKDIAAAICRLIVTKEPEWGTDRHVARWDHPLLDMLQLEDSPELHGVGMHITSAPPAGGDAVVSREQRAAVREDVEASFIGITSADYLVTATATLAMRSRPGHARSVSLVPSIHVAVVEEDKILANLAELYTLLKWDPEERAQGLTSNLSLVSGPSKTGDIELHMVHGAHGPRELHLFVVQEGAATP